MKTILTSVLVGSLLTTLAPAQQSSLVLGRRGLINNPERRTAESAEPAIPNLMVYAINIAFQFGAVDLRSGAFLPIGPGLPPDVGDGLVQGPGTSLLSLGFDGNLVAIDPFTGQTSVVGATKLGDCSTPVSPCGPNSALWIGLVDGHYYVTDFANNLYALDPRTGATKLIGPTGIPGISAIPFSENPDGSVNVFGASLFGYRGKFYAYFSTLTMNFANGTFMPVIPGEIYQIDPATGHATPVAPTETTLSAIVTVNGEVYAFNAFTGQVLMLDPTTGQTTPISSLDPAAAVIAGAAPARPAPAAAR
ncbi:MAG TPA: hypothetical protein VKV15_10545 [Bryobacteraceae bacterium]|nr:hypothetical protein [Bryobacteraceae bacterium]